MSSVPACRPSSAFAFLPPHRCIPSNLYPGGASTTGLEEQDDLHDEHHRHAHSADDPPCDPHTHFLKHKPTCTTPITMTEVRITSMLGCLRT